MVETVEHGPYELRFRVDPNRAAIPNSFSVSITKDGKPVRGADVTTTFTMLDMEMGQLAYSFRKLRRACTHGRPRRS